MESGKVGTSDEQFGDRNGRKASCSFSYIFLALKTSK